MSPRPRKQKQQDQDLNLDPENTGQGEEQMPATKDGNLDEAESAPTNEQSASNAAASQRKTRRTALLKALDPVKTIKLNIRSRHIFAPPRNDPDGTPLFELSTKGDILATWGEDGIPDLSEMSTITLESIYAALKSQDVIDVTQGDVELPPEAKRPESPKEPDHDPIYSTSANAAIRIIRDAEGRGRPWEDIEKELRDRGASVAFLRVVYRYEFDNLGRQHVLENLEAMIEAAGVPGR